MTDYAIIDSSGAAVGTLFTDPVSGRVTATVQMLGEPVWSRALRDSWCDVTWDGFTNGKDWDVYMDWFVSGDPRADFDKSGWVNGLDSEAFTQQFIMGGF